MSQQPLNKLMSQDVRYTSRVIGVNGATGFAGAAATVIPEVTGSDYLLEANIGPVTGATGTFDIASIQLMSYPSNLGLTGTAGLPLALKGHGVNAAGNTVTVRGYDSGTVVRFVAQGDAGLTGGGDISSYLAAVVTGLTGSADISVALTSVSKGSYNIPQ